MDGRWLILTLGLSLALPLSGCTAGPGIPNDDPQGNAYQVQQFYPNANLMARQRIRQELERGYPDYSPSVQALNVRPIIPGQRYAFRARVTVIGIAGPSLPLRYLVEGTYDRRQNRVIETRRTPIDRPSGR
jgi:hypothetical protein